MTLDSFSTTRLLAERLTAAHLPDLRRMDQDELFMARLGGVRDSRGTAAYLAWNLEHWADHGFGLWMLREAATRGMVGRAVLRHLDVEGVDEVEVGYGFVPEVWGAGWPPRWPVSAWLLGAIGWDSNPWSRSRSRTTSPPSG